jgi:hypothetical protein
VAKLPQYEKAADGLGRFCIMFGAPLRNEKMQKRYEAMECIPTPHMCRLSMMYGRPVVKLSSSGSAGKYLMFATIPILLCVVLYFIIPGVAFFFFGGVWGLAGALLIWSAIWCKQSVWITFDTSTLEVSKGFSMPKQGKVFRLNKTKVENNFISSANVTFDVRLGEVDRVMPELKAVDRKTLEKVASECVKNNIAASVMARMMCSNEYERSRGIYALSDEDLYTLVNTYRERYRKTECIALVGSEYDYRDLSDYLTKLIEIMLDDSLSESYGDGD